MIKTYNMVRRHTGDDLAEIVISFIMPESIWHEDICNAGAGELVALIHTDDYSYAYDILMESNDVDLANVLIALDPDELFIHSEDKCNAIWARWKRMMQCAIETHDVRGLQAIMFDGSIDYCDFDKMVELSVKHNDGSSEGRYINEFLTWCSRNVEHDEFVKYSCSPLFVY